MNELYRRPELYESLFRDYREDIDWLWALVSSDLGASAPSIAELACGGGRILGEICRRFSRRNPAAPGRFLGLDISDEMLGFARANRAGLPSGFAPVWARADILSDADITAISRRHAGGYDYVLLMANSLGHFLDSAQRRRVYASMKELLSPGGKGIVAVLTSGSFADSERALVEVGQASTAADGEYAVYEMSRRISEDVQELQWFFSYQGAEVPARNGGDALEADTAGVGGDAGGVNPATSGGEDFENTFHLCRFTPGQLAAELREAGFEITEERSSFSGGDNFWEICVYR